MANYREMLYPDIGLVTWEFHCGLPEAIIALIYFFERYWVKGYKLLISTSPNEDGNIRIYDIPRYGLTEILPFIFATEGYNRAITISRDSHRKEYTLLMELPLNRVDGAYRVLDRDLIRLSADEEKAIARRSA